MPHLRLWSAAVLLAASATVLGWGVAPAPHESHVLLLTPKDMELPGSMQQGPIGTDAPGTTYHAAGVATQTPASAVTENRRLLLEFPARIRRGDSESASLILEMNTAGPAVSGLAGEAGAQTGEGPSVLNVYDTHNVIAEAQLDMAGMDVRPSDTVSEPLPPGDSAVFRWRMHPAEAGNYTGTSWLFLNFIDKSTQRQSRVALSAQTIRIKVTSLFGLGGSAARLVGATGLILAGLVGFPYTDDVLKWLRGKVDAAP